MFQSAGSHLTNGTAWTARINLEGLKFFGNIACMVGPSVVMFMRKESMLHGYRSINR